MQQKNLFEDGSLSKPVAAALAATALVAPALASLSDGPSRSLSTRVWYALLRKPRFNPPKAVFPSVWTALDGALAVGAYRLARGFDIGIASSWTVDELALRPEQWADRVAAGVGN